MATEADIKSWLVNEYGDRDFNQLCQALMWQACARFGSAPVTYSSAIDAWHAAPTVSTDAGGPGEFVYWDIGAYGHVGFNMDGNHCLMGTTHTAQDWGWTNRGWQDPYTYGSITGAWLLGTTATNGANTLPFSTSGGGGGGGGDVDYAWGLTPDCQAALQNAMNQQSPAYYTGPVDGAFGENSVKGMQEWLKDLDYLPSDYVVDGIPGEVYGTALQELARDDGVPKYTGPIDGLPGESTSKSLTGWANEQIPTDPPDPPDPPDVEIPTTPTGTVFGVDVATSQGDFNFAEYKAGGGQYAIIKMGGGNASDSPYVAPQYTRQLRNAREQNIKVGHYWFNGRENGLTPTTSANYMVANMDLAEGDIVALDVEDETDTGTTAYTSAEAHEFANRLVELLGPGLHLAVYANSSVWNAGDWSWIEEEGHFRWRASWSGNGGEPGTPPPEPWGIWQYTSVAGPIPGWDADSLDGNAIKTATWSTYGYTEEEDPPDPEPDALAQLFGDFLRETAALAEKYADQVDELEPDADPAEAEAVAEQTKPEDPDYTPRHRKRRGLWGR